MLLKLWPDAPGGEHLTLIFVLAILLTINCELTLGSLATAPVLVAIITKFATQIRPRYRKI